MTDDAHDRQADDRQHGAPVRSGGSRRRRIWLALAAVVLLAAAVIFVPGFFSLNRYKGRIAELIGASLGRPVRLSNVEPRLFPRPGFVITDFSVAEDPAYGAEPVLHADTVTASIRLLSLLGGRLAIDSISMDDASLNLVRNGPGQWNLAPLFRTAAKAGGGTARRTTDLPTLEATDSRINIKDGVEKLPFSLVNTDFEFWQPEAGEWRLRLRGQPARTDLSLNLEDTGEVRLEASVKRAAELTAMPINLDLEWREAQLGQLARLLTGSDPGWRGDLTGELHLEGTADAAQIRTQLRATNVHRAEFAPAEALDFDANCTLVYHYSQRALENAVCDSPLGDGRVHLTGDLPAGGAPKFTVELVRVPVAAGLGALRTVRDGVAADLDAAGTLSGEIAYESPAEGSVASRPAAKGKRKRGQAAEAAPGPLTGSLTVEGLQLTGAGLSQPLQAGKVVLEPVEGSGPVALAGTAAIPAGGATPLAVGVRLGAVGYQLTVRGQAGLARARELAAAAGLGSPAGLDGLSGDPIVLDMTAAGPWLPVERVPAADTSAATGGDSLSGTLTVRNGVWGAGFLAGHVQIAQTTLHLNGGQMRWDPVTFTYGALKGTGTLELPAQCEGTDPCEPQFQVQFGDLDAARVQTAVLGVEKPEGTLLSSLIDRLHPSSAPPWPKMQGTVTASSLALGPVTLHNASATVEIDATGAKISDLMAQALGGTIEASGSLERPASDQDKPDYTMEGHFENLSAAAVGQLIGLRWTGSPVSGSGKVELAGYTGGDLASSAKGTMHFECGRGGVVTTAAALGRFDRWTADAAIADGAITLGDNAVVETGRKHAVEAALKFGEPPRVAFQAPTQAEAEKPATRK
jgi:AsmA protein